MVLSGKTYAREVKIVEVEDLLLASVALAVENLRHLGAGNKGVLAGVDDSLEAGLCSVPILCEHLDLTLECKGELLGCADCESLVVQTAL